jgi:serine protease Do
MKRRFPVARVFAIGVVVGALSAGAWLQRGGPGPGAPWRVGPAAAQDLSSSRRTAIVSAAQRVSPAVVSVTVKATHIVRTDPFGGMLRDPFFEQMMPPTYYSEPVRSLGSGVIVDAGGIVLSNEHVVHDADSIDVTLPDGRKYQARLLGSSPTYDLAILKIEGSRLPVAALGNSDGLVVGEWAIAIGNPFGYLLTDTQPTVTAGVVSATRRDITISATGTGVYKNMIQTDAAINPGNSGGPLVNGDGEVIGINTFILSSGGGSVGIGFAIPINLVKRVLAEVRTYGRMRSAWPGMQVQEVTSMIAQRLGWRDLGGMVVTRVEPGGPAEKAGVHVGDRIRRVNDVTVNTVDDAQRSIYGAAVGDRLALVIERAAQTLHLAVTLAEAPRSAP